MKRIFMIEDNEDHALLIRRAVESDGCAVTHYPDGPTALKACEKIQSPDERADLILLDLKLPGMDGFEVLQGLKKLKLFEQVPVVMLTTSRRREEIDKAYQLGASGFVVKAEDFAELVAKLKQVKEYWFSAVEPPYSMPVASVREP
ncbi:MAG: hypothetical protein A3C35_00820 [Omnitrophica bacterium RIFCSPHIGHO2_02_FULL_46_11]|nr:MAG: hypothetical protein A3A81_02965 [Omnitrophica bacterium RIFCSPLOWO2_01_FULL_45_10b]OGW87674.1 MAG: hypothetical protein A3C35_00820 [Omnitrophica bacterium RIFCSPHIGHO2_02_FULL_46_11]